MKRNQKILSLINAGLKGSTLNELNENQINALYKRLLESKKKLNEVEQSTSLTYDPKVDADALKDALNNKTYKSVGVNNTTGKVTLSMEEETTEDESQFTQSSKFSSGEDPQQDVTQDEGPSDNMSADDGMGMFEGDINEKFESKKQQKYFFSKCGDGKTKEQKKWCKMAKEFAKSTKNFESLPEKKTETKETFSFPDYFKKVAGETAKNYQKNLNMAIDPKFESRLETRIIEMIEKHISPKMTKKEFINTILESEKEIQTPVKPDVDTPSKPKTDSPYQPKHKPVPKAKEKEIQTPVKPDVKPGKPNPQTPYQPKHKPAPKAKDLPDWLSFDKIGINLK